MNKDQLREGSTVKIALVIHEMQTDLEDNLNTIGREAKNASQIGAQLVVFSETALTGLVNSDNPTRDRSLGHAIPGSITGTLGGFAKDNNIWLALGLLEREGEKLYDTALLFDNKGDITLKYRRISLGWHGEHANPQVYCHGSEMDAVNTPFGLLSFAICGDLFYNDIVEKLKCVNPDILLHLMARSFDDGSYDQAKWENEELPEYLEQVKEINTTVFMTNYISRDNKYWNCFGGAYAISSNGVVIKNIPLGKPGNLLIDYDDI